MSKNTSGITAYAKQKNRETIDRVNQAIDQLKHSKTMRISFNAVTKKAGVSRATLYNNPILKERIQSLRELANRTAVAASAPMKTVQSQNEKLSVLRQEIASLKLDKQKLIVQLADMEALMAENYRLKKQVIFNGVD